ncbi:hypothetical protein [Sphingomonas astaxanthinifaciens]|nr:hypothetical protein [Sphingomonas astaxanthinifaciens]
MMAAITAWASLNPSAPPPIPREELDQFDPELTGISSIDELVAILEAKAPGASAVEMLDLADALIRRRFFHSYSYFRFDQNWILSLLKPLWSDLASPVRPDDILKFRRAACSQQSIVLQAVASRLGLDYQSIGVNRPGHFLAAVRIDGRWWVYDADREIRVRRYPLDELLAGSPRLNSYYGPVVGLQLIAAAKAGRIQPRDLNRNPAPQASMLHLVTNFASRFGWLVLLLSWAILSLAVRRPASRVDPLLAPAFAE